MKVNKGFIVQKMGDTTTIFDGEKSQLITFNETASYIFKQIKKGLTRDKIIEAMKKRYKEDEKVISKDVSEVIGKLKKLKIIS